MRKNRNPNASFLSAVLSNHVRYADGSQKDLAKRLGVAPQTVNRWVFGDTIPRGQDLEQLARELALPADSLRQFGKIGLLDVCKIIADRFTDESPAEQDRLTRVQGVQDRFAEIVADRAGVLPTAAYLIFITGNDEEREGLVDVLGQHTDRLPLDITPDTLHIMLELSGVPPASD